MAACNRSQILGIATSVPNHFFTAQRLASGATVTIQSDGNFSYDPGENFAYIKLGETYEDTLAYVASDGEALSNSTSVTVTISGENSAPVVSTAKPNGYGQIENISISGDLDAGDIIEFSIRGTAVATVPVYAL